MEVWKKIEGFEDYEVSNLGNVKNINKNKILKQQIDGCGYYSLSLYVNGIKKFKYIHRLIALGFIDAVKNKNIINHKDGNKLNNSISNLEWVTQKENCEHSIKNGLQIAFKGEECGNSKLTEEKVLKIREMYFQEKISQKELGCIFNVTQANINAILNKKTWKHI